MLFRAFEPRSLTELARVRELAVRVRERFDANAEPEDILRDVALLEAAYQALEEVLPAGVTSGNLSKHIHFLGYYLKQNHPEHCRDDIRDICQIDLPRLERGIQNHTVDVSQHDAEFLERVGLLVRDQHLDSAVRLAFVILKERLVTKFGLGPELDGADLVNTVFGTNGPLAGQIDDAERRAMRNLLDGLYGVFRNRYGHRDVQSGWFDAASVLGMIDWVLRTIDEYPTPAQN